MARLRVHGFSISVDGDGASPRQGLDDPLGADTDLVRGGNQFELPYPGPRDGEEHAVHLIRDPPRVAAREVRPRAMGHTASLSCAVM
jgi:hypothetical protein